MKWFKTMCAALAVMILGTCAAWGATDRTEISVAGGGEDAMVLDTGTGISMYGISCCRHLFEGLYKMGPDGEIVLGQAESVDVSDDYLTWTFKLRDDATWSDGKPVTVDDFVAGWTHMYESNGPFKYLADSISATLDLIDDKTLALNLEYPCEFLPSLLAFVPNYPIRQDYLDKYGEAYATDPEKAVYNGPFELTEWKHGEVLVTEKRADYYDAANISVSKINWLLMTNEEEALEAFERGEIAYSDLCPEEEKSRMEGAGLSYASGNNCYTVMFNNGEKGNDVLKDVRVRKALSLAIDRYAIMEYRNCYDEIAKTYLGSGYVNEEGVDFTDYAPAWFDVDDYEGNCEQARELLAEAGYPDGEGFPELIYIVNNDSRREVAQRICYDWQKQLGIDSITVYKVDNFYEAREAGDYDLAYFGWVMDYADPSNMFFSMTTMDDYDAFWSNEEYNAEFTAAVHSATLDEQWEHYAECERILAEETPIAIILHGKDFYLFDDAVYDGLVYSCGCFVFTYLNQIV